jgi:hypothetical protein
MTDKYGVLTNLRPTPHDPEIFEAAIQTTGLLFRVTATTPVFKIATLIPKQIMCSAAGTHPLTAVQGISHTISQRTTTTHFLQRATLEERPNMVHTFIRPGALNLFVLRSPMRVW